MKEGGERGGEEEARGRGGGGGRGNKREGRDQSNTVNI